MKEGKRTSINKKKLNFTGTYADKVMIWKGSSSISSFSAG